MQRLRKNVVPPVAYGSLIAGVFCCLISAVGCGQTARQIYRDTDTGVVAIPANSDVWPMHYRQRAEDAMARHFPAGYEIVREEETVVGQTTRYREDQNSQDRPRKDGAQIANTNLSRSVTTSDKTEYRIHYRRR